MMDNMSELTKEEAKAAVERCAFETEEGRRIHCFLGGFGADWDVEGALHLIDQSSLVGWVDSILGKCLLVRAWTADSVPRFKSYVFDTVTP
jgi:hypothetical protein